jgi:hypothetical protein
MRSLLAVAALAVVHAQQSFWPQTGGGRFRAGVWPPSKISGNVGDEGEVRRVLARVKARSYSARPPPLQLYAAPRLFFRAPRRRWAQRRRRR